MVRLRARLHCEFHFTTIPPSRLALIVFNPAVWNKLCLQRVLRHLAQIRAFFRLSTKRDPIRCELDLRRLRGAMGFRRRLHRQPVRVRVRTAGKPISPVQTPCQITHVSETIDLRLDPHRNPRRVACEREVERIRFPDHGCAAHDCRLVSSSLSLGFVYPSGVSIRCDGSKDANIIPARKLYLGE